MSRVRQSHCEIIDSESDNDVDHIDPKMNYCSDEYVAPSKLRIVSALRRVSTKQSPYFKAFYNHIPLQLTLDPGAEVSMIKASSTESIGVAVEKKAVIQPYKPMA